MVDEEQHRMWRDSVPNTYDLLLSHALVWPSLTVEFYPTVQRISNCTFQNVVLCTHSSGVEQDFLLIGQIPYPERKYSPKTPTFKEIPVVSEINRARYCPIKHDLVAARTDLPETLIFDVEKHSKPSKTPATPDLSLRGHAEGGYGLSWSRNGHIATCGKDGRVLVYDIHTSESEIDPIWRYNHHVGAVGDICFSYFNQNILFSVGDDLRIYYHDLRYNSPYIVEKAHKSDIFAVHASPVCEYSCATGSKDGLIHVWDTRNLSLPLHILRGGGEILQVRWSPYLTNYLAACGSDNRVRIFDINELSTKSGDNMLEPVFVHNGHSNAVTDLSWNPLEPMEICSVSEDNIMQIWQTKLSVVYFDLEF